MARFLKIQVPEHIYWAVVALSSETGESQASVCSDLIHDGLRSRAHGEALPFTSDLHEAISDVAGFEHMPVETARDWLAALGFRVWVDDQMELVREEDGNVVG